VGAALVVTVDVGVVDVDFSVAVVDAVTINV
jgi:hypothetical protein